MDEINRILDESPEERATELSPEQQKMVLEIWNNSDPNRPPELKFLTEACWGKGTDSRSWKGRLVREFLATRQLKAKKVRDYIPKDKIELTNEQKEYISNNCAAQGVVEIAQVLFNNPNLTPLNMETRAVMDYIKELAPPIVHENVEDIATETYNPPKSIPQIIARINRYVFRSVDEKNLSGKMRRCIQTLMGYLYTPRFRMQINTYSSQEDRVLFESEFIRCVYDKDDLTEEEVDQYIIYSTEVLIGKSILDRVENLEREQDNELEEGGRLNLALVEAVKSLRDEYNKCITRQNKLLSDLKGKRSERLSAKLKDTASILNLVQLWREEESRKQLIELAEKERESIKAEIQRLSSMDEVRARIIGLTEEEALYG